MKNEDEDWIEDGMMVSYRCRICLRLVDSDFSNEANPYDCDRCKQLQKPVD